MKKISNLLILLAVTFVFLMPVRVQALAQLDDSVYNCLFNNASSSTYNTGAVILYRGWNANVGYNTEMIKAIPHLNVINLTGQTLQFTGATGCFVVSPGVVGQQALMRENVQGAKYAYSFDLTGVGSAENNLSPGPSGTNRGDSEWWDAVNKGSHTLTMSVGSNSFELKIDSTNHYNASAVAHADLITMSLSDTASKKFASYCVNNNVINRGMVYLTGYKDASGKPFEVILVAGDRTNITFLVKYTNL